ISLDRQLSFGRDGDACRRPRRVMAALYRAGGPAELRYHSRYPAGGGDGRHGHPLRVRGRRNHLQPGGGLSPGADGRLEQIRGGIAGVAATARSRSLAALARRAVRAEHLFLSRRDFRQARGAAMSAMASRYLTVLGRELHYVEWGARDRDVVVMWHGLARTSRDFDDLAENLADRYRIICPDTIGRGLSQWSPAPEKEYCLDFYAALAAALVDALGIARLRWIGTSMGGAIGMKTAAGALKDRISHLVLNDIGPKVADAAVA